MNQISGRANGPNESSGFGRRESARHARSDRWAFEVAIGRALARMSFAAAVASRRRWTRRSRTSPSSSTARQSQNCRPPIRIGVKIGLQLRLARAVSKVAQGEGRRVVEGLTCRLPERRVLVGDAVVEIVLHRQHGLLGRFEHGVEAAQHRRLLWVLHQSLRRCAPTSGENHPTNARIFSSNSLSGSLAPNDIPAITSPCRCGSMAPYDVSVVAIFSWPRF